MCSPQFPLCRLLVLADWARDRSRWLRKEVVKGLLSCNCSLYSLASTKLKNATGQGRFSPGVAPAEETDVAELLLVRAKRLRWISSSNCARWSPVVAHRDLDRTSEVESISERCVCIIIFPPFFPTAFWSDSTISTMIPPISSVTWGFISPGNLKFLFKDDGYEARRLLTAETRMKLQGARQLIFFLTFFGGLPETRSGATTIRTSHLCARFDLHTIY
jgi:hypothetical protein